MSIIGFLYGLFKMQFFYTYTYFEFTFLPYLDQSFLKFILSIKKQHFSNEAKKNNAF